MESRAPERPPSVDLTGIDTAAFARDVDALRDELVANFGEPDLRHFAKMRGWSRTLTLVGYGTAWLGPNPISALLISIGSVSSWITMHHISHRGYDRVPGVPRHLTSRVFAQGRRRYWDWFDWMLPEAWSHEHNHLHHPNTGQDADPDLVERNAFFIRESRLSMGWKALILFVGACTWRFAYYAPNTIRELYRAKRQREGRPDSTTAEEASRQFFDARSDAGRALWKTLLNPRTPEGFALWTQCLLPYVAIRFALVPALFLFVSPWAAFSVLVNSLLAEALMNFHSFAVIGPNHAGDDIPRFEGPSRSKGEFYVRQVVGSANFTGGTDLTDFLQGYLNYQIEHHVWPDMPMLKYREAQPRLEAICARHGVPYIRQNVFRRIRKMVEMILGINTTAYARIAVQRPQAERPAA